MYIHILLNADYTFEYDVHDHNVFVGEFGNNLGA